MESLRELPPSYESIRVPEVPSVRSPRLELLDNYSSGGFDHVLIRP